MRITGVLLAAGESQRMRRNKLLLPYGNRTVLEESLTRLIGSGVNNIIVVTGHQREIISRIIRSRFGDDIKVIYNENYRLGRPESVKRAITEAGGYSDALLYMVADKPSIKSDLIKKAIDEFKRNRPMILYINTPNGRGHPVIFSQAVFGDLMALAGEPAGDSIIEKFRNDTIVIEDDEPQIDIDTVEDYDRILNWVTNE